MSVPFDTNLLINVFRESTISLQKNKSSRIESILGELYNSQALDQSINKNIDLPIISKLSTQNSPPIQSNIIFRDRYKSENRDQLPEVPDAPPPRRRGRSSISISPDDDFDRGKNYIGSGVTSLKQQQNNQQQFSSIPTVKERNASISESIITDTTSINTTTQGNNNDSAITDDDDDENSSQQSSPPLGAGLTMNFNAAKNRLSKFIRPRHTSGSSSGHPNTIDEEVESSDASSMSRKNTTMMTAPGGRVVKGIKRINTDLTSDDSDVGLESDTDNGQITGAGRGISRDKGNFSGAGKSRRLSLDSDQALDDEFITESIHYSDEGSDDDDDDEDYVDGFDSDDYLDDSDYMFEESLAASSSMAGPNIFHTQSDTNSISKTAFNRSRNSTFSLRVGKPATVNPAWKNDSTHTLPQQMQQLPEGHKTTTINGDHASIPHAIVVNSATSYQNTNKTHQALRRNSKSFSNISASDSSTTEFTLNFSKKDVPPKPAGGTIKRSKLTSLIKKSDADEEGRLTLDYFDYVAHPRLATDKMIDITVYLPSLKASSQNLKVNGMVSVFELIGFILHCIKKDGKVELSDLQQNPNRWGLFLADEDGEIEDDFGVLGRTRQFQSYGADE
ncbi:unnamed protein product [Ambrosiozyma monospora]|uniref:Unnamed protein product n=1 Tax=Ambrosiozyma monospora TaxID=43982 RepID=A0A9W7DFE5_AMBMO|nr:unnamed protein product [Ambrosiozyma monospora]